VNRRIAHPHAWQRVALTLLGVFVFAVAILPLSNASATTSAAASWTGPSRIVSNRGAPLDWCPGNASLCSDSLRVYPLAPGAAVTMVCWIDARYNGFGTPRWFYVTAGGYQGFVKAELVTNQNPHSPWCLDNGSEQRRAVAASLQATGTSEIYQVYPTATDKANAANVYHFNNWGTYQDWSGDCVMFTALSWYRAKDIMRNGLTAAAIATSYANAGLMHTDTSPPRGAAAFWHWGTVGHVAISLGNGMIVTTQGLDNDRKITTNMWLSTETNTGGKVYWGWVAAP
jgi:hypothetical protein